MHLCEARQWHNQLLLANLTQHVDNGALLVVFAILYYILVAPLGCDCGQLYNIHIVFIHYTTVGQKMYLASANDDDYESEHSRKGERGSRLREKKALSYNLLVSY